MTALCLLNHDLTESQKQELKENWNATNIVFLPKELGKLFCQFPQNDITKESIMPFVNFIQQNACPKSPIVIQGEAGLCFALVSFCLDMGFVPLHAVTKRVSKERKEGQKIIKESSFVHERFREYKRYSLIKS